MIDNAGTCENSWASVMLAGKVGRLERKQGAILALIFPLLPPVSALRIVQKDGLLTGLTIAKAYPYCRGSGGLWEAAE